MLLMMTLMLNLTRMKTRMVKLRAGSCSLMRFTSNSWRCPQVRPQDLMTSVLGCWKQAPLVIAGPLASTTNMSIQSGVVPAKSKQSRITPIFKEVRLIIVPFLLSQPSWKYLRGWSMTNCMITSRLEISYHMTNQASGQVTLLKLACLMFLNTFSKTLTKVCHLVCTLAPSF